MRDLIAAFVRDESGTAAIEYGLIAALISIPVIASARDVGVQISALFNHLADAMKSG